MTRHRLAAFARSLVIVLAVLTAAANRTALPFVLDLRAVELALLLLAAGLLFAAARSARNATRRVLALAAGALFLAGASLVIRDFVRSGHVEEVQFGSGDIVLHGSLFVPRGNGPHPAVVLLHGSGDESRDDYRFYARLYAQRGIAALAYDKRGSGVSGGDGESASYSDLADDAVAAVQMLRGRGDILADRVGIWGLSEGEWTGPLAASRAGAAFLVLVSAAAMTPAEQVRYETGAQVRAAGFSEQEAREAADLYGAVSEFERSGAGRDALNARLAEASTKPWFDAAENLERSVPEYSKVLALPWFPAWRSRMDFDAMPVLASLTCPVLAQSGEADPKNDGAAGLERMRAAMARGGNTAFTGIAYPGAEHGMVVWRLPFRLPPPFFASGYLDAQLDWVAEQVGK